MELAPTEDVDGMRSVPTTFKNLYPFLRFCVNRE